MTDTSTGAVPTMLTTLAELEHELARIDMLEREYKARQQARQEELARLTDSSAHRVLAAGDKGEQEIKKITREANDLRDELATITSVLGTIEAQRQPLRIQLWRAAAAAKRAAAQDMRAQAAERSTKTKDLLRQLKEWEGVGYVPGDPQLNGYGRTESLQLQAHRMENSAHDLEFKADELERKLEEERSLPPPRRRSINTQWSSTMEYEPPAPNQDQAA